MAEAHGHGPPGDNSAAERCVEQRDHFCVAVRIVTPIHRPVVLILPGARQRFCERVARKMSGPGGSGPRGGLKQPPLYPMVMKTWCISGETNRGFNCG